MYIPADYHTSYLIALFDVWSQEAQFRSSIFSSAVSYNSYSI